MQICVVISSMLGKPDYIGLIRAFYSADAAQAFCDQKNRASEEREIRAPDLAVYRYGYEIVDLVDEPPTDRVPPPVSPPPPSAANSQ